MYSQAINTISIQNGPFLTNASLTGMEDRYLSFFIYSRSYIIGKSANSNFYCIATFFCCPRRPMCHKEYLHLQTMRLNLEGVLSPA